MLNLIINGEPRQFPQELTVSALIEYLGYSALRWYSVLPRTAAALIGLSPGIDLEISFTPSTIDAVAMRPN